MEWLGVLFVFLILMTAHSILRFLDDRDFKTNAESEGWWDNCD